MLRNDKKTKKFRILLIFNHNTYNLYNTTNIATIAPRGNFTKETTISLEYGMSPLRLGGDGEFRSIIFSGGQAFLSFFLALSF